MKSATMLYRCPGPETFEGVSCETTIVDEYEVEEHVAAGWSRNWIEADELAKAATSEKLLTNETEQKQIEQQLQDAGAGEAALTAIHKGRGKWDVVDAAGAVVASGLTGEEAKARAGG
jgi:hypothetical protein